ncbi:MAG TPA: SAM-dependent chlorinase/fluorinase [Trebonia sp.]|jgi:hypothetical protein|nr:SAM-dependent chlorinase/fluorinase [Trebonia sp.]
MASFHCLTFLTDYGLEDGFVAACHGVSSQIAPNIRIIDITHLVPPGDIRRGAAVLAQTVPYMPLAVHVAVVDPGVGTARRGVAVAARNGSVFVGPDNGLLPWAAEAVGGPVRALRLTNRELWLGDVTATFHGRDIFVPVAAHLAAGTPFGYAGTPLDVADLVTLPAPVSRVAGTTAEGEVLTVDRFGNVQLSVTRALAELAGLVPGVTITMRWDDHEVSAPFRRAFGEVGPGDVVALTDSSGLTAIAVNGGNAAARLGLRAGTLVTISVSEGRMLSQGHE